ncbi:MAG: hypothetical protein AAGC76_04995 [Luteibacter sp.]|uniref:hypothetical protein n=1 Tax=Luteibacter sp. TaxID=1886636 RepID=UPI002808280F|nr:hypothetical protein [Luteibacter sp.]MDQ7995193.1 hypothetical protein [Luteibacter sp.]
MRVPDQPDAKRLRTFGQWLIPWLRRRERDECLDWFHASMAPSVNDALYSPPSKPPLALWSCTATDDPWHGFQATVVRLYQTIRQHPELQACRLVLASPDDLGDPSLYGVEVFDAKAWLATWETQGLWAEGIAMRLRRLLRQAIRRAGAGPDIGPLATDVLRFVFSPGLLDQTWQATACYRPDALFRVVAGTLNRMEPWRFPPGHVVMDAPTPSAATNAGVHQLAAYVDAIEGPTLGLLVTERDLPPSAIRALQTHAHHGTRIIPLSVPALLALLEAHVAYEQGRAPFGACAALGVIERAYHAEILPWNIGP